MRPSFLPALALLVCAPIARAVEKPNVVFILADDLDAASVARMPRLQELVAAPGASLDGYFVNVSLCCPSRVTTLRGQYARNTQVLTNSPPNGGYEKVLERDLEASTVGTWLQAAGYRTGFLGKYLNGYPAGDKAHVPPGWSRWVSPSAGSPYSEYDYTLNLDGTLVKHGAAPADYLTDVLSTEAVDFVRKAASADVPFFLWIAPYAPHSPATPAPRHASLFKGAKAPRTPSFDEADVSDKPEWIRALPRLTQQQQDDIDLLYRKRLQSLQAVDDLIAAVVGALSSSGKLESTYVFFTSDNGFHLGQHRLGQGKQAPYEEDIRVPFFVRGPGIAGGGRFAHLAGNVDLAPTFAELAGVSAPDFVDGRSLVPVLRGEVPDPASFRRAFLVEHFTQASAATAPTEEEALRAFATGAAFQGTIEPPDTPFEMAEAARVPMPEFHGLRTPAQTWVEYVNGERELYDLVTDPYQLENRASAADAETLTRLSTRLHLLASCAGASCREAESVADPIPSGGVRLVVPAVVDVPGLAGARFTSDLVLASGGAGSSRVALFYRPAPGSPGAGGPWLVESLGARKDLRVPDVVAYLRENGYAIPEGASTVGWLELRFLDATDPGAVFAGSRTSTPAAAGGGSYGVFVPAIRPVSSSGATLIGLREDDTARANVAIVDVPGGTGPAVVTVQVWNGDTGLPAGDPIVQALAAGEWKQWSGLLGPRGVKNGWVAITRTGGGTNAFAAYAVANDAKTSDGTLLPPDPAGGMVPVVLRLGSGVVPYTTELVVANPGGSAATARLVYTPSSAFGGGTVLDVQVEVPSRRQLRWPDAVAAVRALAGLTTPPRADEGGTLLVEGLPVLARTYSPNPDQAVGGTLGVGYGASAAAARARTEAWVFGLRQDGETRANVAIADARVGAGPAVRYLVDVFDTGSGKAEPAATLGPYSLGGGDWVQLSGLLATAGLTRGAARVRVDGGSSDFVTYGVLNDGSAPGRGTSDGSALPMAVPSPAPGNSGADESGRDRTFVYDP